MPPPFPFPLFRIWTRDLSRYFPSSGTLHAKPTTPHPPSASCLPTWTLSTGSDLLESIICSPDNVLICTSPAGPFFPADPLHSPTRNPRVSLSTASTMHGRDSQSSSRPIQDRRAATA